MSLEHHGSVKSNTGESQSLSHTEVSGRLRNASECKVTQAQSLNLPENLCTIVPLNTFCDTMFMLRCMAI